MSEMIETLITRAIDDELVERMVLFDDGDALSLAQTILTTLKAEGYMIVPVEPTEAMLRQGCEAGLSTATLFDDTRFACERAVWSTMIAVLNKEQS